MATKTTTKYHYGVGRRKRSVARAKYFPSASEMKITINGTKDIAVYFSDFYHKTVTNMLSIIGLDKGEIHLFINGGGIKGQAEAARLAIAKALLQLDEAYRPALRAGGYLTTDIRIVLPKRPGLRKARKAEQWSKR